MALVEVQGQGLASFLADAFYVSEGLLNSLFARQWISHFSGSMRLSEAFRDCLIATLLRVVGEFGTRL